MRKARTFWDFLSKQFLTLPKHDPGVIQRELAARNGITYGKHRIIGSLKAEPEPSSYGISVWHTRIFRVRGDLNGAFKPIEHISIQDFCILSGILVGRVMKPTKLLVILSYLEVSTKDKI